MNFPESKISKFLYLSRDSYNSSFIRILSVEIYRMKQISNTVDFGQQYGRYLKAFARDLQMDIEKPLYSHINACVINSYAKMII